MIAAPIPLKPVPPIVRLVCRRRIDYSEFRATCPRLWPLKGDGTGVVLLAQSIRGPRLWFADFENRSGFGNPDGGHLLIGGRKQPFPVDLQPGTPFPAAPQLHLRASKVLAKATVRGLPALVLEAPSYPEGGQHGGHVIVVWNPEEHGALVSLHLGAYPRGDRVAAALRIAASWR